MGHDRAPAASFFSAQPGAAIPAAAAPAAALHDTDVTLDGVRLHVVEAGPPTGRLVVLLHGFPEFWWSWHAQIDALAAAGYFVVTPDLRGYNLSDKPAGVAAYDLQHLSGDVAGLIRHYGRDQAAVVGHDWGGGVAWDFAMRHPDLLERLVVLNCPHPVMMVRGLKTLRQLRKSWYMFMFQVPWLPEWYMRRNDYDMLRRAFGKSLSAEDRQRYVEAARQGGLTGAINYYRAAGRSVLRGRAYGVSRVIDKPVRMIWGASDAFLGRELAEPPSEWVPDFAVSYIDKATHWVQADAPDRVSALLLEYLASG